MNNPIYCNVCETVTPHKFRGTQRGALGRMLELYDCLACRDTCTTEEVRYFDIPDNSQLAQEFKNNHPHLFGWLNSGLGKVYLKRQLNRTGGKNE